MRLTDVLIFAEDVGAANYVAELPAALAKHGWGARLLADGHAAEYFSRRGIAAERMSGPSVARQVLNAARPRVLIIGTAENPDTLGLALVEEAHREGIPTVGVVDARMNPADRFRGRAEEPLAYAPNWLLLPDESTRQVYVQLGYPPERVVACGHPHYDYVRAVTAQFARQNRPSFVKSVLPEARLDQPIVVFVCEPSTGLNRHLSPFRPTQTLTGRGGAMGRTQIAVEEFLDSLPPCASRPFLVLRLHPKDAPRDYSDYACEFDKVSQLEPALRLAYAADLVVGLTSMLLFEAVLLGRPTLSILPDASEAEWLPSIGMGITPCVTSRDELRSTMQALLPACSRTSLPAMRPGVNPGALARVVEFVEHLLQGREFSAP